VLHLEGVRGDEIGALANPWETPQRLQVFLSFSRNREELRINLLHEIGHLIDWNAGGNIWQSRSTAPWKDEWEKPYFADYWVFKGANPNDLPSDYVKPKINSDICKPLPNMNVNCDAEDFAETFTWYVHDRHQVDLPALSRSLKTSNKYYRPSQSRINGVTTLINSLP